jgi:type II secretory pathway pseudopilin PulG
MMELLIVVVIVGIVAIMAVPKMKAAANVRSVSAARERVEAMIGTARAAAIHKGRQSLFFSTGNWISVWTMNPVTGYWEPHTPYQHIPSLYPGLSLQLGGSGWNYVWYDSRGMTWAKPTSTVVFRIVGPTRTDSVCVTRMGQILPRGCTP